MGRPRAARLALRRGGAAPRRARGQRRVFLAAARVLDVGPRHRGLAHPGASLRGVLARLEATGTVRHARAVELYLRLRGLRPRVQAGNYEIPPHASPEEIIALFEQGKVVLEQLTVVEGATFNDFLEALDQHPHVLHTLRGKSPVAIMGALGHPGVSPEGEFFPDTYRFAANTPDIAILTLAYDSMQRMLADAWTQRRPGLPYDTPYQALTLASMVEKEAALKSERAQIAGVFVNRLRKRMRLQSDPTVVYGLGAGYDGSIHTRDLLRDTPYNTYRRAGLPPTPVALPGRESVLAAVRPDWECGDRAVGKLACSGDFRRPGGDRHLRRANSFSVHGPGGLSGLAWLVAVDGHDAPPGIMPTIRDAVPSAKR